MNARARVIILAAAVIAGWGGFRLHAEVRGAGDPVGMAPVIAVAVAALAFALVEARRTRPGRMSAGDAGVFQGNGLDRIPAGLEVPRGGRRRLGGALGLGLAGSALYGALGFGTVVLAAWMASLVLAVAALWPFRRGPGPGDDRTTPGEALFLAAVMGVLALLVLPYAASMPFEISTDEIYSTAEVRDFAAGRSDNPLGLAGWWGLPALQFAVLAVIGVVTGTSIEAMRLVSGLVAVATVIPFYLWVRSLNGRTTAIVATAMLAASHSFIGWGRIALTQNVPVLLFAVGAALLAIGLRRGCALRVLLGGMALGFGWYTYPSAQILILVWGALLLSAVVLRTDRARDLAPAAALSLVGFALVALPMFVNVFTQWDAFTMRADAVSIMNPEAVALMGGRMGLENPEAIVRENLLRGLLSFNGAYPYVTYYNPRAGFIDPVSGALLWLGVGIALVRIRDIGLRLPLIGFLGVYVAGLLTEGAPVHGRLLIGVPCVAILSATAFLRIGRALVPDPARGRARRRLTVAFLGLFVILNLTMFRGFVGAQLASGTNDVATAIGRTLGVGVEAVNPLARFFGQAPSWDPRTLVVLLDDPANPLYNWADREAWVTWAAFFSDPRRVFHLTDAAEFHAAAPGEYANGFWTDAVLFMRTSTWERERDVLTARFPGLRQEYITDNHRISAVYVSR